MGPEAIYLGRNFDSPEVAHHSDSVPFVESKEMLKGCGPLFGRSFRWSCDGPHSAPDDRRTLVQKKEWGLPRRREICPVIENDQWNHFLENQKNRQINLEIRGGGKSVENLLQEREMCRKLHMMPETLIHLLALFPPLQHITQLVEGMHFNSWGNSELSGSWEGRKEGIKGKRRLVTRTLVAIPWAPFGGPAQQHTQKSSNFKTAVISPHLNQICCCHLQTPSKKRVEFGCLESRKWNVKKGTTNIKPDIKPKVWIKGVVDKRESSQYPWP